MTEPKKNPLRNLPLALVRDWRVQLFVFLLMVIEGYNLFVIPSYLNTQKGIETQAVALYAALKQKADAQLAEWKSITQGEIAQNAERRQRADAKKATADAKRSEAEAITARETANYSKIKAKGDADAAEGELEIKEQLAIVERERAEQAERLNQAETTNAEYKAMVQKATNMITTGRIQYDSSTIPGFYGGGR